MALDSCSAHSCLCFLPSPQQSPSPRPPGGQEPPDEVIQHPCPATRRLQKLGRVVVRFWLLSSILKWKWWTCQLYWMTSWLHPEGHDRKKRTSLIPAEPRWGTSFTETRKSRRVEVLVIRFLFHFLQTYFSDSHKPIIYLLPSLNYLDHDSTKKL